MLVLVVVVVVEDMVDVVVELTVVVVGVVEVVVLTVELVDVVVVVLVDVDVVVQVLVVDVWRMLIVSVNVIVKFVYVGLVIVARLFTLAAEVLDVDVAAVESVVAELVVVVTEEM